MGRGAGRPARTRETSIERGAGRVACAVLEYGEMLPSQFLRSPFVRIPFLAFAVFSSVATTDTSSPDSTPGWTLRDQTSDQTLALGSGETAIRTIAFDATRDVTLAAVVRSASTEAERIDISIRACAASGLFEQTRPAEWHRLESLTGAPSPGFSSDIRIEGPCSRSSGTVELRITNLGPSKTSLVWRAEAATFGPTDEMKVPSGAFVHVRVGP